MWFRDRVRVESGYGEAEQAPRLPCVPAKRRLALTRCMAAPEAADAPKMQQNA